MLPRLPVVLGLACLTVLAALTASGCSSSRRRDQYFGTDEGSNYRIPDAAGFSSQVQADGSAADAAGDAGSEAVPADALAQELGRGIDS
jgi:hypothetical protein